jgi:hypothetical protein
MLPVAPTIGPKTCYRAARISNLLSMYQMENDFDHVVYGILEGDDDGLKVSNVDLYKRQG